MLRTLSRKHDGYR